jgi:predicted glycosyltransferase
LDILHPAHVHFFRNAITSLEGDGHEVLVTSRDKDITHRLLDLFGISYRCLSREAGTKVGLARELISRNWRMARIVREFRPGVMASIGGISTAQVGFLTRTPNLIFYDTENASLSNFLSYPLATRVITPRCYKSPVRGRHITYAGYHELAYLHPRRFTPDPNTLRSHDVDPDSPYSVVRFVSWKAMHDIKARGFSLEEKVRLARTLEAYGKVFITSETPLPGQFERYRLPLPPHQVHHLLAFSRLFIGESATMASESAVLGTPFVYLDTVGRGYTDEQQERYGLGYNYRPWESGDAIACADRILSADLKRDQAFRDRHRTLLSEKIDVTDFMVKSLLEEGRQPRGR